MANAKVGAERFGDERTPRGSLSELQAVRHEIYGAVESARDLLGSTDPAAVIYRMQLLQLASLLLGELKDLLEPEDAGDSRRLARAVRHA